MTKEEAQKWYRRLCRCIKSKRFCIKLKTEPDAFGGVDWGEPDTIKLNPRRSSPMARTLIHELIHLHSDELPESRVLKLEQELFEALSDRQLQGIIKRAFTYDLSMET